MSSSAPAGGAGTASNAQRGAAAEDPYDEDSFIVDPEDVVGDGYIQPDLAEKVFRAFCTAARLDPGPATLNKVAVLMSHGTSAETDMSERLVDPSSAGSCLQRLVDLLGEERVLLKRHNKIRPWCRSMPGFSLRTRRVILANTWLAKERAAEYEVDVRYAGVCFDYAEPLVKEDMELTPTELQIVKHGLRHKAGQGRPAINSGEGYGVPGSAPRDRGVADNIVPDSSRVTGRGSGPYGR